MAWLLISFVQTVKRKSGKILTSTGSLNPIQCSDPIVSALAIIPKIIGKSLEEVEFKKDLKMF